MPVHFQSKQNRDTIFGVSLTLLLLVALTGCQLELKRKFSLTDAIIISDPPEGVPTLIITRGGNAHVALSWTAPPGPLVTYTLQRSETLGTDYINLVTGHPLTNYTDLTALNGQRYYYRVVAVNSGGSRTASDVEATAVRPSSNRRAAETLSTPHGAQVVAIADLNSDGFADLAFTEPTQDRFGIYFGTGAGNFSAVPIYTATGNDPVGLLVDDFNADGDPDIVIANRNAGAVSTISVYLGDGTGAFTSRTDYATLDGPHQIATGDFDSDGFMDLVVTNENSNQISLLLGNDLAGTPDGTFAAKLDFAAGNSPRDLQVGHFNGDAFLDVMIMNHGGSNNGSISVLGGNGAGSFSVLTAHALGDDLHGSAAADFDGDGVLDVAASGEDDRIYLLIGQGDGTFVNASPVLMESGSIPRRLSALDVTGDGENDLVISLEALGTIDVLPGVGDGTFGTLLTYTTTAPPALASSAYHALGEFNQDGVLDLVSCDPSAGSQIGLIPGIAPAAASAARFESGGYSAGEFPGPVISADFNGDGQVDLATANGSPPYSLGIHLNDSTGAFLSRVDYPLDDIGASLAIGDFNGDGAIDVAVASLSTSEVALFLNSGSGTFAPKLNLATEADPNFVLTGDFNEDGKLDLATAHQNSGSVSILLGAGDGTFAPFVNHPAGSGGVFAMTSADFNQDGHRDLAVASLTGDDFRILLGDGRGGFELGSSFDTGNNPFSIVAADFNADGRIDIAAANYLDDSLSIFPGNGDGTFAPRVDKATSVWASPTALSAGDFDGDGDLDLATAGNGVSAPLDVLLNDGSGSFTLQAPQLAAGSVSSLLSVDVNRDGYLDFVGLRSYPGLLHVLKSR